MQAIIVYHTAMGPDSRVCCSLRSTGQFKYHFRRANGQQERRGGPAILGGPQDFNDQGRLTMLIGLMDA